MMHYCEYITSKEVQEIKDKYDKVYEVDCRVLKNENDYYEYIYKLLDFKRNGEYIGYQYIDLMSDTFRERNPMIIIFHNFNELFLDRIGDIEYLVSFFNYEMIPTRMRDPYYIENGVLHRSEYRVFFVD